MLATVAAPATSSRRDGAGQRHHVPVHRRRRRRGRARLRPLGRGDGRAGVAHRAVLRARGRAAALAASADGRFVVVGTRAQREASDTNSAYELYLVDRTAGTARRIAPLPASATGTTDPTNTGAPVDQRRRPVRRAGDHGRAAAGRHQRRSPTSTGWTPRRGAGRWSACRRPGAVSRTTAGTVLQTGASVYANSPAVAVSADGDLVLFYSARADLVAGDTNGEVDLFAKRLSTGAVTRVSTTATGANLPRARDRAGAGADPGRPVRALPGASPARARGALPQDAVRRRAPARWSSSRR